MTWQANFRTSEFPKIIGHDSFIQIMIFLFLVAESFDQSINWLELERMRNRMRSYSCMYKIFPYTKHWWISGLLWLRYPHVSWGQSGLDRWEGWGIQLDSLSLRFTQRSKHGGLLEVNEQRIPRIPLIFFLKKKIRCVCMTSMLLLVFKFELIQS